ncbi:MAG: lysophospholipid acyltransferase family protein [Bacteroidaceae bacterium]|nr:lysophospholipid acyltransferase family protein [Bacteroidaceae bacterium]
MHNKLLYHTYRILFSTLALLPLGCLYKIGDGLCWLLCHVIHYRQKVAMENIRRVYPDWDEARREELLRNYYHYFCDLVVEVIKLFHISEEALDQRVEYADTELVDEALRQGHPVFILMGHFGNWEWAQQVYRHLDPSFQKAQIYRPPHDQAFDQVMQHLRSRFDSRCIRQKAALRTLLKMRKEQGAFLCAFIADQHPNSVVMEDWTTFLGQDSPYITGPEEIGRRMDARFIYLDIERTGRGHYRMTCKQIEPVVNEKFPYTIGYLRLMEESIYRQPELWLWTHRRWYITHEEYNRKQAQTSNPRLAL